MTINRQAGAKACGFSTLNPVLSPASTEGSDTTWGMLVKLEQPDIIQHWSAGEQTVVHSVSHADLLLTRSRSHPCWPLTNGNHQCITSSVRAASLTEGRKERTTDTTATTPFSQCQAFDRLQGGETDNNFPALSGTGTAIGSCSSMAFEKPHPDRICKLTACECFGLCCALLPSTHPVTPLIVTYHCLPFISAGASRRSASAQSLLREVARFI